MLLWAARLEQAKVFRACMLGLSVVSYSLWPHRLGPTRFLFPWNFPGKNTGAGCHFPLQEVFRPRDQTPSLVSPALAGGLFTAESPGKPQNILIEIIWTLLRWPQLKHSYSSGLDNSSLSQSVACIVEWFPSSASLTKCQCDVKISPHFLHAPWGSIMLLHEIPALPDPYFSDEVRRFRKRKCLIQGQAGLSSCS